MRNLIIGAAFALSTTTAANALDCFPMENVGGAMKENGFFLIFEGTLVDGAFLVYGKTRGEWITIVETAEGTGCFVGAGSSFNLRVGTLM